MYPVFITKPKITLERKSFPGNGGGGEDYVLHSQSQKIVLQRGSNLNTYTPNRIKEDSFGGQFQQSFPSTL